MRNNLRVKNLYTYDTFHCDDKWVPMSKIKLFGKWLNSPYISDI